MAKKEPRIMRGIRIKELSWVDNPANQHSHVSVFKRADPGATGGSSNFEAIVKSMYAVACDDGSGAIGFAQLLDVNQQRRRQWEAQEQLYPLFDALSESIRRTAADQTKTLAARMEIVRQSVQDFINAVADKVPDVEQELTKLLKADPATAGFFDAGDEPGDPTANKENDMAGDEKKVAELEGRITALETKSKADEAAITDLKSKLEAAEKAKTEAEAKHAAVAVELATANKSIETAKTDEVIKIADATDPAKFTEVRKSVVGDQAWALFKSQQAAIEKRDEAIEVAKFEVRAKAELGTLPGEVAMKGQVLRAVEGIPDKDVREAAIKMLSGGNTAMKSLTKPLGQDGDLGGDGPEAKLDQLVKKHMVDNKSADEAKAYSAVLDTPEGKALYGEMIAPAARAA